MAKKSLIPDFPASGKKSAKAGNNRLISRPRVKTNAPAVDIGGLINNERKYLPGGLGALNATKRTKVKPNVKKRNSNNSGKMMATPLVKKLK